MKRFKKTILFEVAPAAAIFVLDQLIKNVIRSKPLHGTLYSIPGVLELTHCTNTGAAFSFMSGNTRLIAGLSVILMVLLLFMLLFNMRLTVSSQLALSVMIGAGVGNGLDRVLCGGVTDYIRLTFISFPIFNLADIGISLSVMVLIFDLITGRLDVRPEEKHGANH